MKVYKRNGEEQDFCLDKIVQAVKKANNAVEESERMSEEQVQKVIATVQKTLEAFNTVKVEDIQDLVEKALVKHNRYAVGKAYILYRDNKKKQKKFTDTEEKVLTILNGTSDELRGDNANKHIDVNSSARDYIAGTVCKSIANKILPKRVTEAHKKGWIHFHDADYSPVMHMHNCDLLNVEDMIQNGFQMGDTHIDSPKRFSTGCNLLAQINLIVSGSQYGGQTISWAHLLPLVDKTRQDCATEFENNIQDLPNILKFFIKPFKNKIVERMVKRDIHVGIKTYQYQVLCHHSSNGQTPFVSNNLNLREAQNEHELEDFAFIIEEILKRRLKGVKDKEGKPMSPLFPKLLYWMCDGLNRKGDKYWYLTKLAAKCEVERCQPDILSEKKCREVKKGQIIGNMGCRSLLAPVWIEEEFSIDEKFYWQYVDKSNEKFEGAYGKNFNYNKPSKFEAIPKDDYDKIVINFRGNSGWVKSISEDKIVILKPKVYGRFNMGVVTINLPHAALTAKKEGRDFYEVLDERLDICHEALLERWKSICQIKAKNSPLLWQYGALARLDENANIGEFVRSQQDVAQTSISLGYVGLFETCMALIGKSNTTDEGRKLSKEILKYLNDKCNEWKALDNLGYSIYGTPEESLTYKFATALQRDFGKIEYITDKDYIVNSYHVDPREEIDAFSKLRIEGEFLALSSGGAVSYIETADLSNNLKAIEDTIEFMADNILYAEFNRIMGTCYECGFQGIIPLTKTEDGNFEFTCPCCGNKDDTKMLVEGRICGYLGQISSGNTNKGRLDDIFHRVIHLG